METKQNIASGAEATEQPHDGNRKVQPLVRFFIPAKTMWDGELIMDWEEKVDWTYDRDELDSLNVGWFWVEVKELPECTRSHCSCGSNDVRYDHRDDVMICESCGTYW